MSDSSSGTSVCLSAKLAPGRAVADGSHRSVRYCARQPRVIRAGIGDGFGACSCSRFRCFCIRLSRARARRLDGLAPGMRPGSTLRSADQVLFDERTRPSPAAGRPRIRSRAAVDLGRHRLRFQLPIGPDDIALAYSDRRCRPARCVSDLAPAGALEPPLAGRSSPIGGERSVLDQTPSSRCQVVTGENGRGFVSRRPRSSSLMRRPDRPSISSSGFFV